MTINVQRTPNDRPMVPTTALDHANIANPDNWNSKLLRDGGIGINPSLAVGGCTMIESWRNSPDPCILVIG